MGPIGSPNITGWICKFINPNLPQGALLGCCGGTTQGFATTAGEAWQSWRGTQVFSTFRIYCFTLLHTVFWFFSCCFTYLIHLTLSYLDIHWTQSIWRNQGILTWLLLKDLPHFFHPWYPLLAAMYINGMAVRLVINMGVELVEVELVDSSGVTDRGLDGFSWGVAVAGTPGNRVEAEVSGVENFPDTADTCTSNGMGSKSSSLQKALTDAWANELEQLPKISWPYPQTSVSTVLSLRSWVGKQSSKHGKPPAPRWFPEKLASCGRGYCREKASKQQKSSSTLIQKLWFGDSFSHQICHDNTWKACIHPSWLRACFA